jgi:hypothetical protein
MICWPAVLSVVLSVLVIDEKSVDGGAYVFSIRMAK